MSLIQLNLSKNNYYTTDKNGDRILLETTQQICDAYRKSKKVIIVSK
jgi:hypothetical protein